MKTKYTILALITCGCLSASGARLYSETPVAVLVAKDLKSDKEADKIQALDDLGARGEKAAEAVKPIQDLLKDKSPKVRAHAVLALGGIGSKAKDSVSALADLLRDSDPAIRRMAIQAIRAIHPGPKVMIPIGIKLLEDPDPAIQARICSAIAEGGVESVPGLIEGLKNDKAAYWALIILRDIGPAAKDAVPHIVEKLKDKRPEIRREAVLTLAAMGDAALPALPQVAALLGDEQARVAATFLFGELKKIPREAEATVRANAKSDNQLLSTTSLWAVAMVHPEEKEWRRETTEKLVARLKEKDPFVRVAAARALAALPPAPEITAPIWEKALKDADETTVRNALDALAALGAPAVPRLTDALKHEKFRAEVAYVLGRIGPPAVAATGELAKLVDDKNSRVAHEAIIALGNIGPDANGAVPALAKALDQADNKDLNFAAIAFALGKIGPGAAAAEGGLLKQLQSKDDNVRLLSAWALAKIHPESADVAAKAVPVLIACLALPEPEDRLLASEALDGFGPLAKGSAEALKKAVTDENKDVQELAAKALKSVQAAVAAHSVPANSQPAPANPQPVPSNPRPSGAPFAPGDFVVTVEDNVEVGIKGLPGEIVPKGTKLKVLEVRGLWIGVCIDGKEKTGWVHNEQVGKP